MKFLDTDKLCIEVQRINLPEFLHQSVICRILTADTKIFFLCSPYRLQNSWSIRIQSANVEKKFTDFLSNT